MSCEFRSIIIVGIHKIIFSSDAARPGSGIEVSGMRIVPWRGTSGGKVPDKPCCPIHYEDLGVDRSLILSLDRFLSPPENPARRCHWPDFNHIVARPIDTLR